MLIPKPAHIITCTTEVHWQSRFPILEGLTYGESYVYTSGSENKNSHSTQ